MGKILLRADAVSVTNKGHSDYVAFVCPGCDRRNKRVVYETIGQTGDGRLCFRCHSCYREIEVRRPAPRVIVPELKRAVSGGILDSFGRLIGR